MTTATTGPSQYPFFQLKDKTPIAGSVRKDLQGQNISPESFTQCYKVIMMQVFTNKKTAETLTADEKKVFDALNTAARKHLAELKKKEADRLLKRATDQSYIDQWQKSLPLITNLSLYLELGGKVLLSGSLTAGGLGLFYLRSHKLIALACGCYAVALFVFSATSFTLSRSSQQIGDVIDQLTPDNWDQFSLQLERPYTELKKANRLMRFYLRAQEKTLPSQDRKALQLFREQLSAMNHLKNIINYIEKNAVIRVLLPDFNLVQKEAEEEPEKPLSFALKEIKDFFAKFEIVCRKGCSIGLGVSMLAVAGAYYAYVQRSRLIAVAGIVHFIASALITRELAILTVGSRKIKSAEKAGLSVKEAEEERVLQTTFQRMASRSSLLSLMGLQQADEAKIKTMVVIPFDKILSLIPSWKTAS